MVAVLRLTLLVTVAGCLRPDLIDCGDLVCRGDQVCVPAIAQCADRDRVDACSGRSDGDSCSSSTVGEGVCTSGVCVLASCGDGVVQIGEECDGAVSNASCLDVGFYEPAGLACASTCTYDVAMCSGGFCGDQIVNGLELCDGLPPSNVSCVALGYDRGRVGCSDICGVDPQACGFVGWDVQTITTTTSIPVTLAEVDGVLFGAHIPGGLVRRVGETWLPEPVPVTDPLISGVWGASLGDVWAVGRELLHYDGTVWSSLTPFATTLASIDGANASDILAVGNAGVAYHYDGASWVATTTNTGVNLVAVRYAGPNNAYAIGSGTILHWDGSAWTPVNVTGVSGALFALDVVAPDRIYIGGASGTIAHFDGNTWTVRTLAGVSIRALMAAGEGLLVSGTSGINIPELYYIDETWQSMRLAADGFIGLPMTFLTTSAGERLVGLGGQNGARVLTNRGPSWGRTAGWTDGDVFDLAILDVDEAYAVERGTVDTGDVLYWDGRQWSEVFTTTTPALAVYASASDDVFVVSDMVISHFDGMQWEDLATSHGQNYGIAGTGSEVYAATDMGILRYDRGGNVWNEAFADGQRYNDVHVFADGKLVAVSTASSIHFDGVNWTSKGMPAPNPGSYRQVWGASPSDIWAAGDRGSLAHFDGATWTKIDLGIQENITGIGGTASNDVWLATAFGELRHYDGVAWSPYRPRFDPTALPVFSHVDARGRLVGFAGKSGRIEVLVRHD